jgi:hypothetical protein
MRATEQLGTEFSDFFGGASGFDDVDFVEFLRDESVPGTGLSLGALGSVARRQLVGSIVVACGIAAAAALLELRPIQIEMTNGHAHSLVVVQNPSFVTPARYNIAEIKQRDIELP